MIQMIYGILADCVVLLHLLFIIFAVSGGFLLFWSKRFLWIHLPMVAWATFVEFSGWICPLTPLENFFRQKGGGIAYRTGFIERYLIPVIYPEFLDRNLQIILGFLVLAINVLIYWLYFLRDGTTREVH